MKAIIFLAVGFTVGVVIVRKLLTPRFEENDRITAYYFTGECHEGIVITVAGNILKYLTDKGNMHTAHVYQCRKRN